VAAGSGRVPLIRTLVVGVVWSSLAAFSAIALILLPLLDDYAADTGNASVGASGSRAPWLPIVLALAS
jgi:hypothetical protein